MTVRVLQGHVLAVLAALPAKSAHVCVTSPPYWGLRSYSTPPQIWGGANDCTHRWGDPILDHKRGQDAGPSAQVGNTVKRVCPPTTQQGAFCQRCGAWRGELGSEPTLSLFVSNLVTVFEAVKRVLRDDGTLWVNLGDSYAGSNASQGGDGASSGLKRDGRPEAGRPSGNLAWQERAVSRDTPTKADPSLPAGNLCMAPARFALAMQAAGWRLRSEITLCLSGGTRVYARTAKGDQPAMLKDLVRLDPLTVKLWNGTKWTQVLAWTRHQPTVTWEERHAATSRRRNARQDGREVEPSDYLELRFRSGERVGCTPEHLWPTQRGIVSAAELRVGDVVPTTRLPEPEDARRPRALDDEEVGWFVGFYLAEGNRDAKALHFSMHAKETAAYQRIKRLAEDFHGSATWRLLKGNGATTTVYGRLLHAIVDTYIRGHGAEEKGLTNACWQRSDAFLRALLQGYLEGDGHWNTIQKQWFLGFTRNDELAADLRTLAARLGAVLRLRTAMAKMGDREFPSYRGTIRLAPSQHHAARANGELLAIEASRARVFWDVTVEDEPHLFALASGLLTHNCKTAPMPESVQGARWEKCRVKTAVATGRPVRQGDPTADGWHGHAGGPGGPEGDIRNAPQAEWADCPGCGRCEQTDGLVQRWGSGRPTSAVEKLFLFAKGAGAYFYDLEGVRVPSDMENPRQRYAEKHAAEGMVMGAGATGAPYRAGTWGLNNPAGRNLWNYVMWQPEGGLKEAHYAAYPRWLPRLAIQAGTSERGVCPTCGAPWLRVISSTQEAKARNVDPQKYGGGSDGVVGGRWTAEMAEQTRKVSTTLGWRQSCRCPAHDPVPATVLDPFAGSGTTLLEANALGRHGIGVELNSSYCDIAERRLGGQPLSLFAWEGEPNAAG